MRRAAGWESVDLVGITTKLVELAAILVVLRGPSEAHVPRSETAATASAS